MLLVTTRAEGRPAGCLVGFATQCSINPARFVVCLSDKNHTFRAAEQATALVVHLIPDGSHELAELFGAQTQDETDKFARCHWHRGPADLPVLDDCPLWFAGRIVARHRFGDHVGFVLEPFAGSAGELTGFVGFQQVRQMKPGHEA